MRIENINLDNKKERIFNFERMDGACLWMLIVVKSKAVFTFGNKEIPSPEHSFVLLTPEQPFSYRSDDTNFIEDSISFIPTSEEIQLINDLNIPLNKVVPDADLSQISALIKSMSFEYYSTNKNREASIDDIIEAIEIVTKSKSGNYMVFFPSYKYLEMVKEKLTDIDFELISQESNMTDSEKNEIISKFKNTTNTKVGLCVLGGAFSEGVDLIGDALSGVIIVGVGLPLFCDENNILKDYFEEKYSQGYDYAYTYPGFTKVIQAVGRVIRDKNDRGIALLMDERFTYSGYRMLYPPHWKNIKIINSPYNLKKELEYFNKGENKNGN